MTDLAIETNGLTKRFGSVQALESLNLQVPRGSIFGFLGPNGAGKSTTIKLLLRLSRPTAGTGQIFGLDVRTQSLEIRRKIGHLAQEPQYYDDLTVRETLPRPYMLTATASNVAIGQPVGMSAPIWTTLVLGLLSLIIAVRRFSRAEF